MERQVALIGDTASVGASTTRDRQIADCRSDTRADSEDGASVVIAIDSETGGS